MSVEPDPRRDAPPIFSIRKWTPPVRPPKEIAKNDGDVLIYALYPVTGLRFLRWKYGLEEPPPDVSPDYRPPTADAAPATGAPPADLSPAARAFNVHVGAERFQVVVDPADGQSSARVRPMAPRGGSSRMAQPPPPAPDAATPSMQNAPEGGALLTSTHARPRHSP